MNNNRKRYIGNGNKMFTVYGYLDIHEEIFGRTQRKKKW